MLISPKLLRASVNCLDYGTDSLVEIIILDPSVEQRRVTYFLNRCFQPPLNRFWRFTATLHKSLSQDSRIAR